VSQKNIDEQVSHPEYLYCRLDKDKKEMHLSEHQPQGEWAKYKRSSSDVAAEYYELHEYSEESSQIFGKVPIYFYAEVGTARKILKSR
jgi:hypothetical protein